MISYFFKAHLWILILSHCLKIVLGMHAGYLKDDPFLSALKDFSKAYDSSCATLLYTPKNLKKDYHHIFQIFHSLGSDFSVDLSVKTSTFQYFIDSYNNQFFHCTSPINIIIHCDEDTRRQFKKVLEIDLREEVLWIIYLKSSTNLYKYFEDLNMSLNLNVIALHVVSDDRVEFYEIFRVSPERPLRIQSLGQWVNNRGSSIINSNMYTRRNDLEGISLRTGSTQNEPIHSVKKTKSGKLKLVGYFPEVWSELETQLNFTSEHFLSVDEVTGMAEPNGTWNGLIGMLIRNEIDVAVSSFIIDRRRLEVLDFTKPLVKTSYQIYFKSVGPNYNWDAILRPFGFKVWLCLLGWVAISSIVLNVCHWICRKFEFEKKKDKLEFTYINCLFLIIRSVCSQGHNLLPVSIPCRIIILMGYLTSAVLNPSYSASLISYLTFREPIKPFDNLRELLADGTYKLQTNAKTADYTYFSEATDPTLQNISKKILMKTGNLPLNTREGLDRVCKDSRLAHFGEMLVAYNYLPKIKLDKNCDIVSSQTISTIYCSMALVKGSPYKSVLNHNLQQMEDFGVISRAREKFISSEKLVQDKMTVEVTMADVIPIFTILIFGWMTSFIVLLSEIVNNLHRAVM